MNESSEKRHGVTKQLEGWLRGARRIAVMGIGNPVRKDDFIGMVVVRQLKRMALSNVHLIETGEVPESFLGLVEEIHPTHVLMIDAAEMGEPPGTVRLVSPERISGLSLSTHTLPLSVVSEYLAGRTKAKIGLLAIQPMVLDFGEGLTPRLSELAEELPKQIAVAVKLSRETGTRGLTLPRPGRKRLVR